MRPARCVTTFTWMWIDYSCIHANKCPCTYSASHRIRHCGSWIHPWIGQAKRQVLERKPCVCELCELWSGEEGICVSGVGFWLLRMRPKRAVGVSQATGGVGVLGSWFRKKVCWLWLEGREVTEALERVCKDPATNRLMGHKDIWILLRVSWKL